MSIAQNLKKIRKEKGVTQKQVAISCGMAEANYRKYELGKANPKLETLRKIATALGVTLSDLIDDLKEEQKDMENKLDMKAWLGTIGAMEKASCEEERQMLKDIMSVSKYEHPMRIMGRLQMEFGYGLDALKQYYNPLINAFNKWCNENVKNDNDNNLDTIRLKKGEASKQLQCAKDMPPLKHKANKEERFDISKSEVAKWLIQQPDILQYVFTRIKNSGLIIYDQETGCWCGVNNYEF